MSDFQRSGLLALTGTCLPSPPKFTLKLSGAEDQHGRASVRTRPWVLKAAIQGSGNHAHYFYLWALVKYDYYTANGLRVPPPSIDDLLAQAGRAAFDTSEARHLLAHVPAYDNPIVQRIRARR